MAEMGRSNESRTESEIRLRDPSARANRANIRHATCESDVM